MSANQSASEQESTAVSNLYLEADVLVIGGGPAGAWAAYKAAVGGVRVVLVDKGYCGSSGATASGGTTVWYVPPEQRETVLANREALGGFLSERSWMERVLDRTHANLYELGNWGYPFPSDEQGKPYYSSLQQGAEYMRLMRKQIKKVGVQILDHCPALELLVDGEGAVAGATGIRRQAGGRWQVRAGAVVIASGGCAFLSKALGCNVLTGDGYLMAAEAGAAMSGMEFSNIYGITPAWSSVTKGAYYRWATFTYEDNTEIESSGDFFERRWVLAKALLNQPVYCSLHKTPEQAQVWMRTIQHNFFLPFDRVGIDPFKQRFPITLRLEGTVRGTGGIQIIDNSCATSVPGLYAVGDAATRELVAGGASGGGSINAAWAMSSGYWAGEAAAKYVVSLGAKAHQRQVRAIGGAGIRSESSQTIAPQEIIRAVQAEVIPYDRNLFRTERGLSDSLERLHSLWRETHHSVASDDEALSAREAAAMVATARWMYSTALARTESRSMHKHEDYPEQDPKQQYRLLSGGLDHVWVKPDRQIASKELIAL
ncbi:FAD-binding protein [Aetokthonos hydrillicola Thurmond2011]|uniref:FAD-binding protein n=1 Tax=Aetokthonos hydrillicola Thurmond2011 TaxID=2712845 RepID=A0AAP5I8B8_9CYAN|nr:FAD-binding protein [Aetokthonos hydrillicola]MBW4590333.1 FAD-binding protein [Aetokthonos hydrillicola CCALA 1050]MDR9896873.1 FAD-binding protein [Aetokthonos hydrillicola Thurmond2011]